LSIEETAEATGLSRASLYRAIGAGTLATVKVGSRRLVSSDVVAIEQRLPPPPHGACVVSLAIEGLIGRHVVPQLGQR